MNNEHYKIFVFVKEKLIKIILYNKFKCRKGLTSVSHEINDVPLKFQ